MCFINKNPNLFKTPDYMQGMVDIRQFKLIKKELEKYPLKIQYIYLLQLQKYVQQSSKDPAVLKEIDSLLKQIEGKFSNDLSWKRDVLTTLASMDKTKQDERTETIRKQPDIEQIIQQTPQPKQNEELGVKYGQSESSGYMEKGYFSKHKQKTEDLYSTPSSRGLERGAEYEGKNLQEQQERFQMQGYHRASLQEGIEEHQKGKKHSLYHK